MGASRVVVAFGQLLNQIFTAVQFAFYVLGIVCFIKYRREKR